MSGEDLYLSFNSFYQKPKERLLSFPDFLRRLEKSLSRSLPEILRSLHNECGHLGVERTSELLKDRFYWPAMANEVEQYIKTCGRCILRTQLPQRSAALNQITGTGPLDLVSIDFLQIEPDSKGTTNVLVVTDYYTRYAQAFPTGDQKALR